jgi:DNA-binding HxlR family transcriptional regulator
MRIEECPVRAAVEVIGGKWKPMILRELKDGPRRFGELRRAIPGVRHKVLAEQLQQLQRQGVLSKKIEDGKILQTEYRLSEYGTTLRPVLEALAIWGIEHMERGRSKLASSSKA